ncbi:cysteine desulfurase family protein [Vibrio penaeicida]|uniref:cysteine desulfurase family protein n=1 Tax=Vibrio penaeicida TaxID=104609 RepID=UPI0027366A33|nr:cysteine desulfurase family protein [Vibrio penaeicida]MDP2571911.1 cysteine desulfurase family protein [Vibrio penaeicida]
MTGHIYLDYQATTPLDSSVLDKMMPYLTHHFANASSAHELGVENASVVESSRRKIARHIGAKPKEILFTSGATESNNLAISGVASVAGKGKVITVKTEHKCVLESCSNLSRLGFEIVYLDVDRNGFVCLEQLKKEISTDTVLVSVMYGNNETGVLHPIQKISAITKKYGVPLHCDATQSIGLLKLHVQELGVDLLTFSSHKIYGPKGVGALYVRNPTKLIPLIHGGQQEKGLRSGTYNLPGIVGLEAALGLSMSQQEREYVRLKHLRAKFLGKVSELDYVCNTPLEDSLPHCVSLSLTGVNMQKMLPRLKRVILSTGSACNSGDQKESHVLMAMGLSRDLANSTIRVSFGRNTTLEDVEAAAQDIIAAARMSISGGECEKLES